MNIQRERERERERESERRFPIFRRGRGKYNLRKWVLFGGCEAREEVGGGEEGEDDDTTGGQLDR